MVTAWTQHGLRLGLELSLGLILSYYNTDKEFGVSKIFVL